MGYGRSWAFGRPAHPSAKGGGFNAPVFSEHSPREIQQVGGQLVSEAPCVQGCFFWTVFSRKEGGVCLCVRVCARRSSCFSFETGGGRRERERGATPTRPVRVLPGGPNPHATRYKSEPEGTKFPTKSQVPSRSLPPEVTDQPPNRIDAVHTAVKGTTKQTRTEMSWSVAFLSVSLLPSHRQATLHPLPPAHLSQKATSR